MAMKIDHIGVCVSNLEETIKAYCDVLGLKPEEIEIEIREDQNVKTALIPIAESWIELMAGGPESVPAKFVEQRGQGVHHIAIGVSNIKDELKTLKARGIPLIDAEPRIGTDGRKMAFLHPKTTKTLMELVERDI
ncbi:VOC family protein [Chloroflexota bacterium]